MKKYDFQNRRKFLTSKRLVCLLEFSLESVDSSAITVQNDGRWNFYRQEKSPNSSYYQPKIAQKLIEKTSMTDIAHQLAISTSTVIRKLNDFHFECNFKHLPEIMSWDEYAFTKERWVSLRKILISSISSLFLRVEHKPSFEITFLNMIGSSDVEWKLLLWICLVLIMT